MLIDSNEIIVEDLKQEEQKSNGEVTENNTSNNPENNEHSDNSESNKEIKDEVFESAKESTGGKFDTLTLIGEVAKLEAKLDNVKSSGVNESEFYKNLSNYLTDEQLQLRFEDDPSNYIKAVNTAKEKWLNENKVDTTEDEKALATAQANLLYSKAIDTVLKDPDYKDFNFVKLQDFYHNDLTKKEQAALDKGSSKDNLAEYFKKVHDEYKKRNPKNVKNVQAPNIPDASKASKTSIDDTNQMKNEKADKDYRKKIGFRKL